MKTIQMTWKKAAAEVTEEWGVSEGDGSFEDKVLYFIGDSREEIDDDDDVPRGYEVVKDE